MNCKLLKLLLSIQEVSLVSGLLERGASVTAADSDGNGILHLAAEHENPEILQWLVAHGHIVGLKIDKTNNRGETILHTAVKNPEYLKTLPPEVVGATVHGRDSEGNTALHKALKGHSVESVQLLLEAGSDFETRNKEGRTPLLILAQKSDTGTVPVSDDKMADKLTLFSQLVEAGADLSVKDNQGLGFLDIGVNEHSANEAERRKFEIFLNEIRQMLREKKKGYIMAQKKELEDLIKESEDFKGERLVQSLSPIE